METTENNKLIAEFMGLVYAPQNKRWRDWFTEDGRRITFGIRIPLQYHKSWDWLMPVVREILTLIDINQSDYDASALKFEVLDDDIKRAYIEVIEFIKNYN